MKKVLFLIALPAGLLLAGCGGKQSNPVPTPPASPAPTAVTLSAPAQNSVCITGAILNATQSDVSFTWDPSANTSSYSLTAINLLTAASTTLNFTATQATITLLRNTPYSWYVTSKSATSTATSKSDTWKFYNAGAGVVSYAPFPAALTSPAFAQSVTATAGTINLTWTGSSVNTAATLTYDVYFGTTNTPPVLKTGVTDSFLNGVAVNSKTTYYWKIITRDATGNTSESGLYQFSTN